MRHDFLVTTSWDDGGLYDEKLSKLLLKYKIPATFYIPANSELSKKQIKKLARNFEIGGHTYSHPDLTKISLREAEKEIKNGKTFLEEVIGQDIQSFCYPKGKFNNEVKQLVGFCGFKYARTTQIFSTNLGDKLRVGTTIHTFSHFYIDWEVLAKIYFLFCKRYGGVFHLWGHSWEIEKNNDWEKLERVFQYISKNSKEHQRITNIQTIDKLSYKKDGYYKHK